MTPACPSDLALETHLLDPAASKLSAHLSSCAHCAARLQAMERQGQDFARFVYPATVEKVEEAAAGRRGRSWLWVLAPIPVLAAAALAIQVLQPVEVTPPGAEYIGIKGVAGGVGLTVFARGAAGATPLADGAHLPAAAAARFRVRNTDPCRLVLFSVDAAGQVSKLHEGAAPLAPGQHDLDGGAVLDGKPGPERFFAVCSPDLAWTKVEALARTAASGGAEAVRRAGALAGDAAKLPQATVLVEKDAK